MPETLVLTDLDYDEYNRRNAYLASKLITIFVEHPIIFIGYSLSDPNIKALLKSISQCIGAENIKKLQDNLIFIDWHEPKSGPIVETSYLHFDSIQVPVKIVRTENFCPVYSAISNLDRKLPARVLRFCKERIYEIVKNAKPDKKIAVMDFDEIDDLNEVEIVFGLGILGKFGERGYIAITVEDLFEDLILENKKYNAEKLLRITFTELPLQTKFTPIYKYLRAAGIDSEEKYRASGLTLDRLIRKNPGDFSSNSSSLSFKKYCGLTTENFLSSATESEIVSLLPLFSNIDISALEKYLRDHFEDVMISKYKYHFRRVMAFYDWLKYGFN